MTDNALDNLLHEDRRFEPPADLAANANVTAETYAEAEADFEDFWAKQAKRLSWQTEPTEILDWSNPPFAKWFADGTLNATYNCLDRHVEAGNGDRVAFYFEGEPGDTREITYGQLASEVKQAANALIELGVKAGDRVAIYLPMIPEAVVAMLACARIGAPHTVVFGGFSADALSSRIIDCGVEIVITADGGYRRGAQSSLKPAVDEALKSCPDVRNVLVIQRTKQDTPMTEGRDLWWHEFVAKQSDDHVCEYFPAEHPLYVMYTSGSTGKPKGILHTTGGYLVGVSYTHWASFDLKAGDRHLLDGRGHRLGDWAFLSGVRTAGERHDVGHVRGHPRHPAQGSLVGDHREVPSVDLVLCAYSDPDVHEVGFGYSGGL